MGNVGKGLIAVNELMCPSCGSGNVKAASLVISDGTFSGTARSKGVGLSSSGAVSVGIGAAKYQHQSNLAASVYTPDEKNAGIEVGEFWGTAVGGVLFLILWPATGSFWSAFFVAIAVGLVGIYMGKSSGLYKSEIERVNKERVDFYNTFICQVCGNRFIRKDEQKHNSPHAPDFSGPHLVIEYFKTYNHSSADGRVYEFRYISRNGYGKIISDLVSAGKLPKSYKNRVITALETIYEPRDSVEIGLYEKYKEALPIISDSLRAKMDKFVLDELVAEKKLSAVSRDSLMRELENIEFRVLHMD